jgi:hypothetical protein
MADQVLEFEYFSGLTLTADLTAADDTLVEAGLSATELTNGKMRYRVTRSGSETGHHVLTIKEGSDYLRTFHYTLTGEATTHWPLVAQLASDGNLYHADIELTVDGSNSKDEYTATWFRNGVRVTSGVTSPLIQVIKRVDGTDLVAETSMTQIGSTASYKYDESSDRVTAGESVLVIVTATINGSARSFSRVCTRDSS